MCPITGHLVRTASPGHPCWSHHLCHPWQGSGPRFLDPHEQTKQPSAGALRGGIADHSPRWRCAARPERKLAASATSPEPPASNMLVKQVLPIWERSILAVIETLILGEVRRVFAHRITLKSSQDRRNMQIMKPVLAAILWASELAN